MQLVLQGLQGIQDTGHGWASRNPGVQGLSGITGVANYKIQGIQGPQGNIEVSRATGIQGVQDPLVQQGATGYHKEYKNTRSTRYSRLLEFKVCKRIQVELGNLPNWTSKVYKG